MSRKKQVGSHPSHGKISKTFKSDKIDTVNMIYIGNDKTSERTLFELKVSIKPET